MKNQCRPEAEVPTGRCNHSTYTFVMTSQAKKQELTGEVSVFVREYKRRAHKGHDPNDRGYDRKLEEKIKRMKPDELSSLLSGDAESGPED
jgi:hypothetical protein